jgi:hypothetical protein
MKKKILPSQSRLPRDALFSTVSTAQHKVHCKEISTYECPKMELRGLSPNFRMHVSVSDLYIPRIGSLFSASE